MRVVDHERLAEALADRLAGWRRLVVCGVGNDLRGDGGVGVHVARKLLELNLSDGVGVLVCDELPENFITKIAADAPSHVVLVDGVVVGASPGSILVIEDDEIYSKAISTHRLPLSFFSKILRMEAGEKVDVFVLGIQIQSCEIGEGLTPEVQLSADQLVRALGKALGEDP